MLQKSCKFGVLSRHFISNHSFNGGRRSPNSVNVILCGARMSTRDVSVETIVKGRPSSRLIYWATPLAWLKLDRFSEKSVNNLDNNRMFREVKRLRSRFQGRMSTYAAYLHLGTSYKHKPIGPRSGSSKWAPYTSSMYPRVSPNTSTLKRIPCWKKIKKESGGKRIFRKFRAVMCIKCGLYQCWGDLGFMD